MMILLRVAAFFLVPGIINTKNCFAQTNEVVLQEQECAALYTKLISFVQTNPDSVRSYAAGFEKKFSACIRNNPSTLAYSFSQLVDSGFCRIQTSGDGNFRIYSWDTWTGGTMHIFNSIYQWKTGEGVFSKFHGNSKSDAGSFCSEIFTVNVKSKLYYLAVTNGIYSTRDALQSISAYTIENNTLTDTARIFRTKSKWLNSIDVSFDFFSVSERPERPVKLITYDEENKIIYVPFVDDKGQVKNKYLLYKLNDEYFEFTGVRSGKQ